MQVWATTIPRGILAPESIDNGTVVEPAATSLGGEKLDTWQKLSPVSYNHKSYLSSEMMFSKEFRKIKNYIGSDVSLKISIRIAIRTYQKFTIK